MCVYLGLSNWTGLADITGPGLRVRKEAMQSWNSRRIHRSHQQHKTKSPAILFHSGPTESRRCWRAMSEAGLVDKHKPCSKQDISWECLHQPMQYNFRQIHPALMLHTHYAQSPASAILLLSNSPSLRATHLGGGSKKSVPKEKMTWLLQNLTVNHILKQRTVNN